METAKQPPALKTQLLPYQLQVCLILNFTVTALKGLQGLAWMMQSEHPSPPSQPDEIVQMWKVHPTEPNQFQHVATKYSCKRSDLDAKDGLSSGGILSDDMVGVTCSHVFMKAYLCSGPWKNNSDDCLDIG